MKRSMAHGVEETLAPFLTDDVAWKISEIIRKENFEAFKLELMDAAYKFTIRKCDFYDYSEFGEGWGLEGPYWSWIDYREVCFPNELGCKCCESTYPTAFCKKNWCEAQECICTLSENVDDDNYYCKCDRPYRRQNETTQNQRDKEQPDYEYFQNQLVQA